MEPTPQMPEPVITVDEETGLPVIVCQQAATPKDEMTPDRLADVLLSQEVEWENSTGRS
jgi:hypothetical protein